MTVNFYLDKKNGKQQSSIFIYVRGVAPSKTIKIHSGERIDPKLWDTKKQVAKRGYVGSPELNSYLNSCRERILKKYRVMRTENEYVDYEDVKNGVIDLFKNAVRVGGAKNFLDVYDDFIAAKEKECAKNTIKWYKSLIAHLKDFSKHQDYLLTFDRIDPVFYDQFTVYMWQTANITNNTLGKYLTTLKTFLNWAIERKYHDNKQFLKFKVPSEEVEIVYLTENELFKLLNFDFSRVPKLERVRDIFCFQCLTGPRFSDISEFKHEDVKNGFWERRSIKTKGKLKIPLLPQAIEILEKYRYLGKFPVISSQKTNDYLKEVCCIAGIDEPTTITRYRGSERLHFKEPKYKFITTHTARRTFITLSLEKGMRAETVMKITGHKKFEEFKKYIVLTESVSEQELKKTWK